MAGELGISSGRGHGVGDCSQIRGPASERAVRGRVRGATAVNAVADRYHRRLDHDGDMPSPLPELSAVTAMVLAAVLLSGVRAAADQGGGGGGVVESVGGVWHCGTPINQPLVDRKGVITTPRFPGPFPVPINCEWVIQAEDTGDTIVEVYFTQLFVTDGFTITEYSQYPPDFGFVTVREVFNKSHISQYGQSMVTTLPYLVIRFRLDRLEGNHIRVHDDLMDVYGFNITYEMRPAGNERNDVCSLYFCSYSGNCLGNADLS